MGTGARRGHPGCWAVKEVKEVKEAKELRKHVAVVEAVPADLAGNQ